MLQGWVVIAVALAYIGLLFLVASYGDRTRGLGRVGRTGLLIYPLSLAIYCTSWTFFGSVGSASRTGYEFLTIYIGPALMIGLFSPLVVRIVRLAKAQNTTSIADFIAARYGKSQAVAATVALIAIVGTIPYIALQLKAVSFSLETILAHLRPDSGVTRPLLGDIALFVALSMATFAVLFGTRHIDATEHQDGLMLAVATESIVKLFAFLAVGIFVTFWMFGGPAALFAAAAQHPQTAGIFMREPPLGSLLATTLLSFVAIILLPRQFHVAVVENNNEREIKRAAWLFPLYLVAINLFVVPIALAGLLTFPAGKIDSDMFMLALPLQTGSNILTIAAFVGGLSAATAMVIVESVALSIMVSNDLIMPLVLQRRATLISGRENIGSLLLTVRRLAIFAILLLAYMYYRTAGDAQLAAIGLLSFAAVAQLAPAFFGGLFWRRATARRRHCRHDRRHPDLGLYAAAAEHSPTSAWSASASSPTGRGDWTCCARKHLFGLELSPLVHGVVWCLAINLLCYVGFSLRHAPSAIERLQANIFVPSRLGADRAELPALALLGDGGGAHHHGRALSRRGAHAQRVRKLRRHPPHQPGAARTRPISGWCAMPSTSSPRRSGRPVSRLVLSLLLRKRTVSTKAALKLLDDANAAIQYNREILQTALDHVRQGIAVFDKDLQLICWNRQFGEILDLPPSLLRVGSGLADILYFNGRRSDVAPDRIDDFVQAQIERYVSGREPFLERFAEPGMVIEVRANHMPDGGIVTTFTDITPSVEAAEALERANETLEQRVRERTEELTRLNAALARAKGEADDANISKTKFLAAASHDILQPLNAARLYVTSLVERQGGKARTPAGRQHRRLARGGGGDFRRAARYFAARHRRDASGIFELPHRRPHAPDRIGIRAAGRRQRAWAQLRALFAAWCAPTAGCCAGWCKTSSPTPSNTRRAGACWSAAGGAATACASTSTIPASAFPNRSSATFSSNFTASIRAPASRAGWAWGSRSWNAWGACSAATSRSNRSSGAARASRSWCRYRTRSPSSCRRATTCASIRASLSAPPRFASTTNPRCSTAWRPCCRAGAAR